MRYIDADKLKEELKHSGYCNNNWLDIEMYINNQPTADVRENVKGRWVEVVDRTEMYDKDIDTMRAFINADSLVGRKDALPDRWPQFPAKKLGEIIDDQDQIDQLKADREAIKGVFKTVYTEDDIKDELVESSVYIRSLIELVRDFRSELMAEKTKKKR